MKYRHLSIEEREAIRVGLELGKSNREIGREIGRSHTTIKREVKRNQMRRGRVGSGIYLACKANLKAQQRASEQRRKAPLKCPEIYLYVREKLRAKWSPEQIAGRLSEDKPGLSIHHETIYRYIYSKPVKCRYKFWQHLTLSRPKRRQQTGRSVRRIQGKIPGAVSIDLRPKTVDLREEFGHLESDLMEGPRTSKPAVCTTVERKTRYVSLRTVADKTAVEKTQSLKDGLWELPLDVIRSITVDNGKENTNHQEWTTHFKAPVYFCHAYHSWEKGTVENVIGRVRRFIPKGTDLNQLPTTQLQAVQDWLNHTPRKCLNWRTPYEALQLELQLAP